MNMTPSLIRCLLAVLALSENYPHVASKDVAHLLGVKKPTVHHTLETLRDRELIDKELYGDVHLTETGKHLTGTVIYGYLWNEARDQWLVDPEAAEVVKRIFAMTIDGYGPYQIASKLKEEKVLIPSAYLARHGEGVNKNKTFKDVYGWGSSTICNILEKREYLGHTINFKTRKHFKDKKSHYVPVCFPSSTTPRRRCSSTGSGSL